jgi:hypothetical protein
MYYPKIKSCTVTELGLIDWETGYDVWNGAGFETQHEALDFGVKVKGIVPHAVVRHEV